jgi:carboxypeptidase family protein/TonB-dependent receptor-like protein
MTGKRFLLLLVLTGALPALALAQARLTGADLQGTITDESGAVVPGARVTTTNVENGLVRLAVSDTRGRYVVAALPPGSYKIAVEMSGFANQTRDGVALLLGQAAEIDFTLKVASGREEVTVSAEAPVVDVAKTAVSSVVGQQQIENLPINGRNFISFSAITPGVAYDRTPQQGASATSGLSFTGQRARSNNIMVDGLDNNDPAVGAVRAVFSQEAIREFQVLTDSYSAEFGKAAGGVVNIVTKSGTNELHGNTFFYLRDKSLNAKNYFDKFDVFGNPINAAKAPFNQKQWGATLGGPIQKDKTFFFLSYERTDIQDARLVTIDPSAASLLNSLGFTVDLGNVPLAVKNNEALAKLDHHWTPDHSLTFRVSFADIDREGIDDFGGSVARSRSTAQVRTDWSVSASETDILSPKWINEFRTQFAHEIQDIVSLDTRCGERCETVDAGGPTLEITGFASVGRQRFTPNLRLNKRLQFTDTLSYVGGDHHVKLGFDYSHISNPGDHNALPLHFGGRYIFAAIPGVFPTALAALQAGRPAAYVQGYGTDHYPDATYQDVSLFAQDEIKLGRLILKPGVRYQLQVLPDYTYDISDVGGTVFSYSVPTDKNNVAPRLAASYDLTGDGRTSLHASYGMFYDNVIFAIPAVTTLINGRPGSGGVRTLVLPFALANQAWNAPGRRLSEAQASALPGLNGTYPTLMFALDPNLKTPYAHQAAVGFDRAIGRDVSVSLNGIYVRGFNQVGTLDYNPVLPAVLGAGRRPNDRACVAGSPGCVNGGIAGTSASVLQYTAFGETWYKGLTASVSKRFSHNYQFLASYTLSKAEDNSTDFQSNFIPQDNGRGRDPNNKAGLPLGFDPMSERGPATHDQRHRFVLSGVYQFPWAVQFSTIFTAASGRPYTPLAGADLNGDGNGGAFAPDRARTNPADITTSVGRNSAVTAAQINLDVRLSKKFKFGKSAGVEAILDVFNVFNRANFIEDTNQSPFTIFGTGAFPATAAPAYGHYTQTLPPRQAQLALKLSF